METVELFTREGMFVAKVEVPPFKIMPEVLVWGQRFFVQQQDEKWYEVFAHWVAPTIEGDKR